MSINGHMTCFKFAVTSLDGLSNGQKLAWMYLGRQLPDMLRLLFRGPGRWASSISATHHKDFSLYPDFFSVAEQRLLLQTSLQQLDAREPRQFRRRRSSYCFSNISGSEADNRENLIDLFYPDSYYRFEDVSLPILDQFTVTNFQEQGHYDGVIHNFREMHLTAWPTNVAGLSSILDRLQKLFPSQDVQTHLLHLASNGEILPHVDNIGASGSWILGVSLGSARILRMAREDPTELFEVLLPSGSVYIQR
jgi:alkylated DNA repair protein alkB homolog 7